VRAAANAARDGAGERAKRDAEAEGSVQALSVVGSQLLWGLLIVAPSFDVDLDRMAPDGRGGRSGAGGHDPSARPGCSRGGRGRAGSRAAKARKPGGSRDWPRRRGGSAERAERARAGRTTTSSCPSSSCPSSSASPRSGDSDRPRHFADSPASRGSPHRPATIRGSGVGAASDRRTGSSAAARPAGRREAEVRRRRRGRHRRHLRSFPDWPGRRRRGAQRAQRGCHRKTDPFSRLRRQCRHHSQSAGLALRRRDTFLSGIRRLRSALPVRR
jgi:hypothetical protein